MTILKGRAFSNRRYKAIALHQRMSYVIHMSYLRHEESTSNARHAQTLYLCASVFNYTRIASTPPLTASTESKQE